MVRVKGVRFPTDAPNYCLHSDIIAYSIAQFTTIRRIMVSNLVSNWLGGECQWGMGDTVHEPDLRLGFENSKAPMDEA